MSLSRKTSDKLINAGRLHVIKNRFGSDGDTFLGDIDWSAGHMKFHSPDSQDHYRLKELMKDGEKETKVNLMQKFGKYKQDNNLG